MTKARRVLNFITGLIMTAAGVALFMKPDVGLTFIVALLTIVISLRGIQSLLYYFTMARFMVGGRLILYRGIFLLDAGLLTSAMVDHPVLTLIVYIAGLQIFTGVIDVLRSRDKKEIGGASWRFQLFYGVTEIGLAAAVIISGLFLHSALLAVYVYAAGILYAGILRAISAFRKTPVVYIQ